MTTRTSPLHETLLLAGAAFLTCVLLGGCSSDSSDGGAAGSASGGRTGAAGSSASGASGSTGLGGLSGSTSSAGSAGSLGVAGSSSAGNGGASGLGGSSGTAGGAAGGAGKGGSGSHSGGAGGAGGGNEGGSGGGPAKPLNGTIVPLYSWPTEPTWAALAKAKQAHAGVRVIAIVNPASGPGASVSSEFTTGIAKLVEAGVVPIGYVSTNYTKRGTAGVEGDVDAWHNYYPSVTGIFFDEQSITPGDEGFYKAVSDYAKNNGLSLTVGNPGTGVPDSFLGTVDIMLAYESAGTPSLASLKKYGTHRTQFGIIPYATAFDAVFVKAAVQSTAYVYLTNDDLPNPWDALPSYFDSLLAALET